MIPFWLWSWVLMLVGVTGLWAAGSRRSWGWLIGLGAQGLWVAYALSTEQLGFLVSAAAYGTVYARNFIRWRDEREKKSKKNKHLLYLGYVLRHKWYVYQEGRKLGLGRAHLLLHDFQKFLPAEWFPYVETFYGAKPARFNGSYDHNQTSQAFDYAWLHHQRLGGKHHWQYWLQVYGLPDGGTTVDPLPMPDRYRREMLADWRGAGRAQGNPDTRGWYEANKGKMILHPETRLWIEAHLYGAAVQTFDG